MTPWWLLSYVILWLALLFLGFLLLGALRALALLRWRLEQLEAITPTRVGRSGLKPGKKAPDFTLPSVAGGDGFTDYTTTVTVLAPVTVQPFQVNDGLPAGMSPAPASGPRAGAARRRPSARAAWRRAGRLGQWRTGCAWPHSSATP